MESTEPTKQSSNQDDAIVPADPSSSSCSTPSDPSSSKSPQSHSPHVHSPVPTSLSQSNIIDLSSPQASPSKRQSATPSLISSRPAPASPASSRPHSTQFDPSSSSGFLRDRSASTSSRGGRRISSSSQASSTRGVPRSRSRASSKAVRPKSMLGTNITLPDSSSNTSTPISISTPSSQQEQQINSGQISIPEYSEPSDSQVVIPSDTQTESFQVILPEVVIRDFAYQPPDERYYGRGNIPDDRDSSGSHAFRWPWKGDEGSSGEGSSSGNAGGWGGFGFLGGWRNKTTSDAREEMRHRPTFEDDDDDDELSDDEGDFTGGGGEEEEEGGYYSSPTDSRSESRFEIITGYNENGEYSYKYNILENLSEEEEPKGYYRAAYPFEAISSSEMNLQEGDLVNLSGRGNGDPGWVIARRINIKKGKITSIDEKVGLVPESYLERVEIIQD
ncbi:uncharacterized protein L201_002131 [Kwoniella dendrophila CBS 6074]|uniref:SH3 domain-containing protein n=1 Tax=Kwoniella dendrophila CBS 6074 TaxID=1295534 RepID=A0AAX4JQU5_9TREE